MKKLDKLENEFLPQVTVDNTEIIFDVVRYLEPQSQELIIANTGQVSTESLQVSNIRKRWANNSKHKLLLQVPVQFEFIKKLDDSKYCKEWLNIDPALGFIMPGIYLINCFTYYWCEYWLFLHSNWIVNISGEKCDVKLEVFVDKRSASKLNCGEDKLYDILVLHLEGGKDIFITVTG